MAKIRYRKNNEPYTMLTIRMRVRDRNKLRVLCAELDVSMQEFVLRLLRNKFPGVISPQKQPRTFKQLAGEDLEQEDENLA